MGRSDSGKIGRRIGIPLAVAGVVAGGLVAYRLVGRRHSLVFDGVVVPCEDEVSLYMVGEDEPEFEPAEVDDEASATDLDEEGAVAATADARGGEPPVDAAVAEGDDVPPSDEDDNGGEGPERTRRNGLTDIEGIGPVYADTLAGLGLRTTTDLLRAGADPKGREDLAVSTGINKKLILRWVNKADLFRIKGVGEQYADLLEAAGVDTVPELAQRRADNLTRKMNEVNEQKRLVRRTPTEAQVASWIESAKGLPRVVTY